MPKKTTNSGLLKKMGSRGQKAFDAHKGDDTKFSAAGDLPEGIEGGIAELVDCKIGKYEKGNNKGELFFYAAGIVVSPVEHAGQRIEGLRTSIMEALHDTPTRSRKTEEDHLDWTLNSLRMLGLDTSEVDFSNLEDALDVLKDAGVYFRFRTWKGEATDQYPNPRVNHQWNGQVDYSPDDSDDDGVVDGTTEEELEEKLEITAVDENDLNALAVAADEGDSNAVESLTEKATLLDITQDQLDEAPSWVDVVEMIENAEKSEKGAEEAFPTFSELAAKADDDDNEEAIGALTNAAEARQLDPDEYESWADLAEELEKAPPVSNETAAKKPDKGDIWYYKPPGKRKLVECEVKAVFDGKETCNLKNLDDGVSYKSVPWLDISKEEN